MRASCLALIILAAVGSTVAAPSPRGGNGGNGGNAIGGNSGSANGGSVYTTGSGYVGYGEYMRTSFALILDDPGPLVLTSSLEVPTRPARSSKPSIFWVYERSSFRFESNVLINSWVGDGVALSMDFFS